MNNTDIETRLREFRKYLLDEIDRRALEVESCEPAYVEYEEGALGAFLDIDKCFYNKVLRKLTP